MTPPAQQPQDHAERLRAADPERSVIVQAPAGSGKTTLLVNRYLGLLARADQPEEVLAITFTRKAAGEMRARVVQALAVGGEIARGALARSKQLGWNLTQQPNRLKIQTIDSFAMALLRQMPLTASFNPRAELIEEAGELYLEAADRLLGRLYNDDPLAEYLADFLAWLGNDQQRAARLLATMLGRRDQWLDVVSQVVRTHQQSPDQVPSVLGAGIDVLNDRLIAAVATELGPSCYAELHAVIDQAAAHLGLDIEDPRERYCFVSRALTTQSDRL
ncbi:MAG: UvrD-helicase domain-containing protein, partial [Gammaproteobacteria bacterium]|nr:UvrD-helicase domain-containing protein [Gammaproteobacteria bacterium]